MKLTELENWLAENGVYHGSNVTFSVDALLEALTEPEDEDSDCYCTDEDECHYCLENKSDAQWLQERENQIALRKWNEFWSWKSEWTGDLPAPQEHMTFDDWLQQDGK